MVILYKYDVIFYAVLLYLPLRDEWIEICNSIFFHDISVMYLPLRDEWIEIKSELYTLC